MNPFEGYTIYGPYFDKKAGRWNIQLVKPAHRTTISYAKYLMSLKLNRWLGREEEVDHINGNCMDDRTENLQILTHGENISKRYRQNWTHGTSYSYRIIGCRCKECKNYKRRLNKNYHLIEV